MKKTLRPGFSLISLLLGLLIVPFATLSAEAQRPNFLIITLEDASSHLGSYGVEAAKTPVYDKLAAEGTRFTNMLASAPVCAPARCSLITGVYATSLGAQHMRTIVRKPKEIRCYTKAMRQAGYFCTNNRKTDYQFAPPKAAWDEHSAEAHWKNRPNPDQPFLAIFNLTSTHQGSAIGGYKKLGARLPEDAKVDVNAIRVPKWLPDTPMTRDYIARMMNNIAWTGQNRIAQLLQELEDEGVADNTFVILFSDHGDGAIPRAKEYLYDSGTRVPFIVRAPKGFPTETLSEAGGVNERLCNFVDLPPTILTLAGLEVPEYMQGTPFMGPATGPEHEYLVATRDRANTRYDTHRAVHDGRYLYIRYLRPYLPLYIKIRGFENPLMKQVRALDADGALSPEAAQFFARTKPVEELYDTLEDPDNVVNLAADPQYAQMLKAKRAQLVEWMAETGDTGMIPEGMLHRFRAVAGSEYAVGQGVKDLYDPVDAFEWMTLGHLDGGPAIGNIRDGLMSKDPVASYWSAVNAGYYFKASGDVERLRAPLVELLGDEYEDVRVAAAFALIRLEMETEPAFEAMRDTLQRGHLWVRLDALNLIDDLPESAFEELRPEIQALKDKFPARGMNAKRYVGELAGDLISYNATK